jgi:spore germination protein GerM
MISLLIFSFPAFGQDSLPIKVYFNNENLNPGMNECGKVYPVTHHFSRKTKAVATIALAELFKGPTPEEQAQGYTAFSARETSGILKSVKIKNGTAYVNFNRNIATQFERGSSACGNQFFTAQIEMTLKQFPGVKNVAYAIEGRPCDYYSWLEFSECPLPRKDRSGKNF